MPGARDRAGPLRGPFSFSLLRRNARFRFAIRLAGAGASPHPFPFPAPRGGDAPGVSFGRPVCPFRFNPLDRLCNCFVTTPGAWQTPRAGAVCPPGPPVFTPFIQKTRQGQKPRPGLFLCSPAPLKIQGPKERELWRPLQGARERNKTYVILLRSLRGTVPIRLQTNQDLSGAFPASEALSRLNHRKTEYKNRPQHQPKAVKTQSFLKTITPLFYTFFPKKQHLDQKFGDSSKNRGSASAALVEYTHRICRSRRLFRENNFIRSSGRTRSASQFP